MNKLIPKNIKIYHIVHIDKLESIIQEKYLWSDANSQRLNLGGTKIGINHIKERRLTKTLMSYPDLCVGECTPFYFSTRSVMLYLFYRNNNPDITYKGGQEPIVHLVIDLNKAIKWANENNKKWAFTTSNAGSFDFEDFSKLKDLNKIDWKSIYARDWKNSKCKRNKQAEFLIEEQLPWELIEKIGVYSISKKNEVDKILKSFNQNTQIDIEENWYY